MSRARLGVWLVMPIVWAHFLMRLHHLALFPGFVDEGNYVHWARGMWQGQYLFYPFAHGRSISIAYLAFFWPFQSPLWVSRAATVLLSVIVPAGLYRLGMMLFRDRAVALAAVVAYAVLPFAFFHERMALSDGPAAALTAMASLPVIAIVRSARWATMFAAIGLMAGAMLAKLSAVGLLLVPLAALWFLSPMRGSPPRRRFALVAAAIALATLLTAPMYLIAFLRFGLPPVWFSPTGDAVGWDAFARRVAGNALDLVSAINYYGTWLLPVGLALGTMGAIVFKKREATFLVVSVAALWLPILTFMRAPYPRLYLVGVPFAALVSVWGVATVARNLKEMIARNWPIAGRLHSIARAAGWMAATAGALAAWPAVRFVVIAYAQPAELRLPARDRYEYLEAAWGSGFGFGEAVRDVLVSMHTAGGHDILILSQDQQVHWRTILYVPYDRLGDKSFVLWDAGAPDLVESLRAGVTVYLLWERGDFAPDFPGLGVSARLVNSYPRPGAASHLDLYLLQLAEDHRAGRAASATETGQSGFC